MNRLTDNQLVHRSYLNSPVWKSKRLEALEFYGCICARCGCHGTDVHHKTYERTGGAELMDDLEILCRDCHKAHHSVDRIANKDNRRGISRRAIFRCLSYRQKAGIMASFGISTMSELFCKIADGEDLSLVNAAAKCLGCHYVFSINKKERISKKDRYGTKK